MNRFGPGEKNKNERESIEQLEILEAFAEAEEYLDSDLSDLDMSFFIVD